MKFKNWMDALEQLELIRCVLGGRPIDLSWMESFRGCSKPKALEEYRTRVLDANPGTRIETQIRMMSLVDERGNVYTVEVDTKRLRRVGLGGELTLEVSERGFDFDDPAWAAAAVLADYRSENKREVAERALTALCYFMRESALMYLARNYLKGSVEGIGSQRVETPKTIGGYL
jgi:hypothetical protein